jgi:hypothetical protein
MPTRDAIEEFNRSLISLGNEPAVRARRNEEIEEVTPPEEGLSEDISELLGGEEGAEGAEGEEGLAEEAGFEDLGETFEEEGAEEGEAPEEGFEAGAEEPAAPEEGGPPPEEPEAAEGPETPGEGTEAPEAPGGPEAGEELDLGDIDIDEELAALGLEEEGEEPAGAEEEAPPEAPSEAPPGAEAEEPGAPEEEAPPGAADEFEELEEEFSDLVSGEELAGLTAAEEEPGEEEPAEEEPAEGTPGEETGAEEFEAPEADLGEPEPEPEAPEAEEPEELGGEFEEPEEFDLSEFAEDFDFSPEEAEVPEFEEGELEAEEPGAEAFEAEEAGFEVPKAEEPEVEAPEPEEPEAEEPEAEEPEAEEPEAEEPLEEGLAPEESEEFSFDFGEEEMPEAPEAPEAEEAFPEEDAIEEPGAGPGAEEEEFTFEDETFEVPEGEEFEEPTAEPTGGEEIGEEDIDEFSLGDFGAEFGVLEDVESESAEEEAELNPALDVSGAPPEGGDAAAPAEVELSEEEFDNLKRTLGALPLNLKIAVEEAIGEQRGDPDDTEELIRMLVAGEPARQIANLTGKILDRRIEVPRGYEKRTGERFEERRASFAYRFRENILPIVRVVGLTMLVLGLVSFLAYRFVYRPLHANNLYERGLDHIEEDRYARGNELFDEALEVWPRKPRFYEYADAFIGKRQFELAREKYETALRRYPGDRTGMLSYARMESEHLSNYETAENLVRVYLEGTGVPQRDPEGPGWGYGENREFMSEIMDMPPEAVPRIEGNPFDYGALLFRGDNFMRWAQENSDQYENARRAYARALEQHGPQDALMFRFLRYFIERDNEEEVLRLTRTFQADPDLEVDTEIYARLGGYLIDKGRLDPVRRVLARAIDHAEADERVLPSAHYHLARYYRELDDPVAEKTALDNALAQFRYLEEQSGPLDRQAVGQFIDTHGRLGEYYYGNEEYLTAREHFTEALERYERARRQELLEPAPKYGRIHAGYGDLLYYVSREYDDALAQYTAAEDNGYRNRALDYKQGFIRYRNEDYDEALQDFFDSAGDYTQNRSILYATANALYHRDTLGAAQGYYTELLDILENQRAGIQNLLLDEDPEHRGLIEYLIKVQNNLGVTLQRIAQRSPDDGDVSSQGLVYLEAASEDAVNYNRNPRTGERAESVNLAYLNMREILYPQPDYDLQIYSAIPKDLEDVDF